MTPEFRRRMFTRKKLGSVDHLGMVTVHPIRTDTANRTAAVPSR